MDESDRSRESGDRVQNATGSTVSESVWRSMETPSETRLRTSTEPPEIDFSRAPQLYAQGDAAGTLKQGGETAGQDYGRQVMEFHRTAQGAGVELAQTNQGGASLDSGLTNKARGDDYSRQVLDFHRTQGSSSVEIPDSSRAMVRTSSELRAIQDVISNKQAGPADKLRAAQLLVNNKIDSMTINGVDYKIALENASNNASGANTDRVKLMQVTGGTAREIVSGQLTKTGELLDENGQVISPQDMNRQFQARDARRAEGGDNPNPEPKPYEGHPLFNPALTPEERLKEADRMYKNGEKTVTGPDGKVYEIREQKAGNRTIVGIFGKDERGKDRPILRGVIEKDGSVNQQRDSKGRPVDYVTDFGKKNPNSPLVKTEEAPPQEEMRPRRDDEKPPEQTEKPPEQTEKPPDQTEKPPEQTEKPPEGDPQEKEKQADRVRRLAEKLEPPEDRQKFLDDMQKFEERARRDNIPQEEVDRTYREMARLMEAQEGKVPAPERQLLAKNLMYHLADPTNIDQGQHNTCNVTTIAERMATRNPSQFVEMARSTALTGQWTSPDGKVIKIDDASLVPGAEENRHPPVDGARSFATQLLNLTMINDMTQREMPPKFYRQERPSGSNRDTGERLYYENGQKADGKVPGVNINQMADFIKRTTGDTGVLIVDSMYATPDMVSISSPEELAAKLKQMQAEGRMPPILMIDANDPLFFNGPPDQNGNWHVVSVTGFDEKTGMVTISNQWGKPQDKQMPIADLYRAMNLGRKAAAVPPPTK